MGRWLARLKNEKGLNAHATKPTKPPQGVGKAGFVGFVASPPAYLHNLGAVDSGATKPDRWCWPHSLACNSKEINTFTARLVRFTDKGLSLADAESEADRLVIRDRECDDRRLCLECTHLQGTDRWRCGNWQAASVARDRLSRVLVLMLQRCGGFMALGENSDQRGICQLISENHPFQGR